MTWDQVGDVVHPAGCRGADPGRWRDLVVAPDTVGQPQGPIQCNSRAQLPAHYFPISRPCKRIMPSGTERNPCSFADIATILRRLHR